MKKIGSILLTICLLMGALAGCSKKETVSPQEGLAALADQMSAVTEGSFDMQISCSGFDLGDDMPDSAVIGLTGTYSNDAKELAADISLKTDQVSVQLTDLVIKDNTMYINVSDLLSAMETLSGESGDAESMGALLGDADYISQESTTDLWTPTADLETISGNLTTVFYNTIEDLEVVTEAGGTYGFTLEDDAIRTLAQALLYDVNANFDSYFESIWSYAEQSADLVADMSGEEPDMDEETYKADFQDELESVQEALDAADLTGCMMDMAIAYDKDSATYTVTGKTSDNTGMEVEVTYTLTDTSVVAVDVPEGSITVDALLENLTTLYDLDGLDTDAVTDLIEGAAGVDSVKSSTLTTFVDRDLSAYSALYAQGLTTTDSSVQLPVMSADATDSSYAVIDSSDAIYLYYAAAQLPGALDTLATTVLNTGSSYEDLGYTDVSFLDVIISTDGTVCVSALSYTDEDGDACVSICLMARPTEDANTVLGAMEINIDALGAQDRAFLADYGQLIGLDLLDYCGI